MGFSPLNTCPVARRYRSAEGPSKAIGAASQCDTIPSDSRADASGYLDEYVYCPRIAISVPTQKRTLGKWRQG